MLIICKTILCVFVCMLNNLNNLQQPYSLIKRKVLYTNSSLICCAFIFGLRLYEIIFRLNVYLIIVEPLKQTICVAARAIHLLIVAFDHLCCAEVMQIARFYCRHALNCTNYWIRPACGTSILTLYRRNDIFFTPVKWF